MPAPGMSEDDLIEMYFAPMAGPGGLGLKDDAALLEVPEGAELVLTNDALVADVHFFALDPPADIARKALRTNLSDLAAKGAEPLGFLLALALPQGWAADWLAEFARGLAEDAREYGIALLGGDTVKTIGPLMVSITALGLVPKGRLVPRTGVRPGDRLYVSGTIGDAALGLRLRLGQASDKRWISSLPTAARDFLLDRYLLPQPRGNLADVLQRFAGAGMDISDGLVGDLSKMLKVSGAGARIELGCVPFSPAVKQALALSPALLDTALTGGDDYELLCAVTPASAAAFEEAASEAGTSVVCIGTATAGPRVVFAGLDGQNVTFANGSFSHF